MTILYLTRHMLQAVVGSNSKKVSVNNQYMVPLQPGIYSSSTMMDKEKLIEEIKGLWEANNIPKKDVVLVLDDGEISNKLLETPMLKPAAMMDYLPPEFSEVTRTKEQIYSYLTLAKDKTTKKQSVFASVAGRETITIYKEILEAAGIEMCGLASTMCTVVALMSHYKALKEQTAVIQIWNGNSLTNVLFVNGKYIYSSSGQMFQEPGTPGFSVEVARQVGRIKQFIKAQQLDTDITNVYLVGVTPDDFSYCEDGIYQVSESIEVDHIKWKDLIPSKANVDFDEMAIPLGALFLSEDYHGLYEQYKIDPNKVKERQEMKKKLRPIAILAVVMLVITGILSGYNFYLDSDLKEIQAYNQSVQDKVAEYDSYVAENASLIQKVNELQQDKDALYSYPIVDSSVVQLLMNCKGPYVDLTVYSYDSTNGILNMRATASDAERVHEYIKVLKNQSIFSDVTYTGYALDSSTGRWTTNVVCTLSESAGR